MGNPEPNPFSETKKRVGAETQWKLFSQMELTTLR